MHRKSNRRKGATFALLAATGIGLAGCGGGNGNGLLGGTGGNGGNINTALANLQRATADGRITESDRANLNAARSGFQTIATATPANAQARAGLGLAELALVQLDGNACVASTLANSSTGAADAAALLNIANPSAALAAASHLGNFRELLIGIAKAVALPVVADGTDRSGAQSCISNGVLAKLTSAANNLAAASNDSAVSIRVLGADGRNTLRRADLQILTGGVQSVQGLVGINTAYNLDSGTFYNGKTFGNPLSFDTNRDLRLSPNEYLAPAPYATLRSGGKAQLATALTNLRGGLNNIESGINAKIAETDSSSEAVQLTSTLRTQFNTALTQIPVAREVLTGAFTVPGTDVTTNLAAYLNNPIADLHTSAPTLRFDAAAGQIVPVTPLPNPTFNGLFPNGLPTSFFR